MRKGLLGWKYRWPLGPVLLAALLLAGCATTDSENLSSRPWNAPKGWEHGLPPSLYEGR